MTKESNLGSASLVTALLVIALTSGAFSQTIKGQPKKSLLSSGGLAAQKALAAQGPKLFAGIDDEEDEEPLIPPDEPLLVPDGLTFSADYPLPGFDYHHGKNVFANDPCMDPPPPNRARTVQSETTVASQLASLGQYVAVGYNDSWGFYDNRQGLSGFAYSIDGGRSFIDGGGLPPAFPLGGPLGTPGQDTYAGDPVIVVHQASGTFYYSSIYITPDGQQTLAVNRGRFKNAPPQNVESRSNTRCLNNPSLNGVPDPGSNKVRLVWEPPVVAVDLANSGDGLDKEWLTVDQVTGELYLTYTRFGADGSTPLELVRTKDGGKTWTPPTVIVPNLLDTFNQATNPLVVWTPRGKRLVVTWFSTTFDIVNPPFPEVSERIEYTYSDDDGVTFAPTMTVSPTNPQGEPPGYNRGRRTILNTPYITGLGRDVYIAFFSGKPGSPTVPGSVPGPRPSDIYVSASHDFGKTFGAPVKVNDDDGMTSHVFQNAQVNLLGQLYVSWQDRRGDPNNLYTNTLVAVSNDHGKTFGKNRIISDVATQWFVRADARPNFGDYNSSTILDGLHFATTWGDGRFPPGTFIPATCNPAPPPGGTCPAVLSATPDTMFTVVGLDFK